MKICFITHDASLYGASRSLKTLLGSFNKEDHITYDLIIAKKWKRRFGKKYLSEWFSTPEENIYFYYLPFLIGFKGSSFSLRQLLSHIRGLLLRPVLKKRLSSGQYDHIYLNSTVLLPLAFKDFSNIIHIREILMEKAVNKYWQPNVHKIKKFIFIDEATYAPLANLPLQEHLILNNPFDMSYLSSLDASSEKRRLNLPSEPTTIFAIIGGVHAEKGTDFVIDTFIASKTKNSRLLIVGSGESKFVEYCKKKAEHADQIIFWGEEKEIGKIYLLADYILRGEAYPCIGRTTYEGLFADCNVIIPGQKADYTNMLGSLPANKISYYKPRGTEELSKLFRENDGKKSTKENFSSNVPEYKRNFIKFINT